MTVGQRIRAKREARKLSQRELAAQVRLHFSVMNRIEQGTRSPSFVEMERIAKVLRCEVRSLVPPRRAA